MSAKEMKKAIEKLDILVEIKDLLEKIDDKLEDLKFIMGASKIG